MHATAAVSFVFGASHTAACCVRSDGHLWNVQVVVSGEPKIRTGMIVDINALTQNLEGLRRQLDGTDLNDMLPGVTTTPEGVAAWVRECLLMVFPVVRVAVEMQPGYRAELEWPLR